MEESPESGISCLILFLLSLFRRPSAGLPWAALPASFSTLYFSNLAWVHCPSSSEQVCLRLFLPPVFFIYFSVFPELFEVAPRPAAMSLGSVVYWLCNLLIGMAFPILQNAWGALVFLPFSINCLLLFLLTKRYLPETRGRDPSEVAPLVENGFKSKPSSSR